MSEAADPHFHPSFKTITPLKDTKSLRVAIFSDSFAERNGAGAYYHDLACQLRSEVGQLELFQPVIKRRFLSMALPLPGDRTQKLLTPNFFRLSRQYKALNPHLVVAVTPGPFGMLGMFLAKRHKAGFITAFHTHFEGLVKMYGETTFFKVAFWYLEQVNKILCRKSATVLINNDDLAPTVMRLGAPKVDVMGTPLSMAFLDRPIVPPPSKLKQVLFAGRLAPEKNLPAVLEAVAALPDIQFVMAGDGPLRKQAEEAARKHSNLRLTGWLNRENLCKEMDAANLLLLPSHMETFGTVALEAMARGRPALVAESAGIHQWKGLQDALFVLPQGASVSQALKDLTALPATSWMEIANFARTAAESLNRQTIDQWTGFISCYAKPLKDD